MRIIPPFIPKFNSETDTSNMNIVIFMNLGLFKECRIKQLK